MKILETWTLDDEVQYFVESDEDSGEILRVADSEALEVPDPRPFLTDDPVLRSILEIALFMEEIALKEPFEEPKA